MKVVEPEDTQVLIPLRMIGTNQGFRAELPGVEKGYGYYVKCSPNPGFLQVAYKGIIFNTDSTVGNTLIFNVKENSLGVIESDTMVEPIDMTVNMERKQA
jgi:hypothetical protein